MPRKYEEVVNDYLVRKFFEEQQEYAQLYGEQSIKPLPEDLRVEEHEFHESSSHQIGDYTWGWSFICVMIDKWERWILEEPHAILFWIKFMIPSFVAAGVILLAMVIWR